jgi:hypothetical protein
VRNSFNLGVEFFTRNVANAYVLPGTSTTSSLVTMGYTFFASYNIVPELALVVRYDTYDPNTNPISAYDRSNLLIAGLSWKLDKNVWFSPNIEEEFYQDAVTPGGKSVTVSPSLTARGTFFYVF